MSALLDLFVSFFKIGAVAFGGGYAMIPLICGEVVDVRGWLDKAEFVDVIAISGYSGPHCHKQRHLCGVQSRRCARLGSGHPWDCCSALHHNDDPWQAVLEVQGGPGG